MAGYAGFLGRERSVSFRFPRSGENRATLEVSYEAFDQRPGCGWRKIADEGKYLEAARLIDRYEQEKKVLEEWQRVNLRFHAGVVPNLGIVDRLIEYFDELTRSRIAENLRSRNEGCVKPTSPKR